MQNLKSSMETSFPDIPDFQETSFEDPETQYKSAVIKYLKQTDVIASLDKYFNPSFFQKKIVKEKPISFSLKTYTKEEVSEYVLIYLIETGLYKKYLIEYLFYLKNEFPNRIYFYHHLFLNFYQDADSVATPTTLL